MAELQHFPKPIRVRLEWAGGKLQTLDGTIDGAKTEWLQKDDAGKTHRFEDSGVVDGDGYHVFVESN
jgi:hypothetical protein